MPWSEESLHRWLARAGAPPGTVGSPGHDAAVLGLRRARAVLCSDQTLEGVHFEPGAPGRAVGRKAAARVISDLAATAARPRALLCNLAAPARTEERYLRAILTGVREEAQRHGAALVGGDLAAGPGPLSLGVSGHGELAVPGKPPGRDRARAGQLVLLTGAVGGSLLGRHLRIEPRVEGGIALARAGATALMDVSDGLARDLARVAAASDVALELDEIPVHRDARRAARTTGRSPRDHALGDGEDHELIATLARTSWARHGARLARLLPGLRVVGQVRAGRGLWIRSPDGDERVRWSGRGGYLHGTH